MSVRAIERRINASLASSCGRLFDVVTVALQCAPESLSYEGEAACALETVASQCDSVDHPVTLPLGNTQLDLAVFWQQWLSWQAKPAERIWTFRDALAYGFAILMRKQAEVRRVKTLVLSGGVMRNRLLSTCLAFYLYNFTLLFPQRLPTSDGGLPLGQGVTVAARTLAQK